MKYKADWPEARAKLIALWEGRGLKGPCVAVTAPSGERVPAPPRPSEADAERRWLDRDWVLADLQASLANTWWGGTAIPSYLLMAGWVFCYGARPTFHLNTIWHEPAPVDFDAPPQFTVDWDEPYCRKYVELYQAAVALAGRDDFLVGRPCALPACDLLAARLGTEAFLVALSDHPQWMRAALEQMARGQLDVCRRFRAMTEPTHDFWYGNPGWMPLWGPRPYLSTQSDVSCMLSPKMFDQFVLPELRLYCQEHGALWYHLDGSDARQHLPSLLSLPELRFVQYVPRPGEPPNGPGQLPLYRQIQAAGRIVHVQVAPEHVLPLLRELDPRLLCLQTWCRTIAEAQELLAKAEQV